MNMRHVNQSPRHAIDRRAFLAATGGGLGAVLAARRAPALAATAPRTMDIAHITAVPESGAVALQWLADEVTKRSRGAIVMKFHGGTMLTKELEIMDAVKSGNVAVGGPAGAASTVFPEMSVFLVPYLIRDYDHAYACFNGKIGQHLDETFQKKYQLKVLYFYDYGFRHFWNSRRPIVEPKDLRGLKLRVQLGKVFADTVNGLGANAVPMPWGEVIPAAQQGVIDGADLPIVNIYALKAYEVSKYASMTYHNYGPTLITINLALWRSLPADQQQLLADVAREAQEKVRQLTESVDNLPKAKELLEPKGMKVNPAEVEAFRKVAKERIWPRYEKQYAELWEEIVATKV